jgi:hypothetical protein
VELQEQQAEQTLAVEEAVVVFPGVEQFTVVVMLVELVFT